MNVHQTGKFNKQYNRGTIVCQVCNKRRQMANINNGAIGGRTCMDCYDQQGIENEHMDGYHEETPDANCSLCKG